MTKTLHHESEPTRFDTYRRPCDGTRFRHQAARVAAVVFALAFAAAVVSASPRQRPDAGVLPLFIMLVAR